MNSDLRGRPSVIDRTLPPTLWAAAVLTSAAALAAGSTWLAQRPWLLRFGLNTLAIAGSAAPLCLLARRAALHRAVTKCDSARRRGPLAEFLLVANHEMKTPLAGIKAYVELLADGDADDDRTREEFLDGVSSQTQRLEDAIDELLRRARAEAGVTLAAEGLELVTVESTA